MSIHVQLERFEGPLGLLLHLIREQEMDIFNINIHQITRQYLEYIKAMRRLDLEVAGEFVAMAATLLHIKSRMLLPQYNEEGEVITEDPRKELVQKLVEYQKMKEFAQDLYKRPLLGRDVFARGEIPEIETEAAEEGELVLEENPLFSLISSFRTAMRNMKKGVHTVSASMKSIAERILEIKDFLIVGKRIVMRDLITDPTGPGNQVLLTFLSLLELAKIQFISIFQSENFGDIFIDPKKVIDRDVVSQVENYDGVNAQAKADSIISDAQLSLEEPVAQFEGEEAPVVEASFAEAASDAEIDAELALLDAEGGVVVEGPGHVAEEIQAEQAFLENTNGPNIMGFEEENRVYDPTVVPHVTAEGIVEAEMAAESSDVIVEMPEVAMEASLSNEVAVEEAPVILSGDQTDVDALIAMEAETASVSASVSESASVEDVLPQTETVTVDDITVADAVTETVAETSAAPFFPQMIQEMPEDFVQAANTMETVAAVEESQPLQSTQVAVENTPTDTVDTQNVTSALSEALAAFDSFNEIDVDKNEPEMPPSEEKPPEVES